MSYLYLWHPILGPTSSDSPTLIDLSFHCSILTLCHCRISFTPTKSQNLAAQLPCSLKRLNICKTTKESSPILYRLLRPQRSISSNDAAVNAIKAYSRIWFELSSCIRAMWSLVRGRWENRCRKIVSLGSVLSFPPLSISSTHDHVSELMALETIPFTLFNLL